MYLIGVLSREIECQFFNRVQSLPIPNTIIAACPWILDIFLPYIPYLMTELAVYLWRPKTFVKFYVRPSFLRDFPGFTDAKACLHLSSVSSPLHICLSMSHLSLVLPFYLNSSSHLHICPLYLYKAVHWSHACTCKTAFWSVTSSPFLFLSLFIVFLTLPLLASLRK